MVGRLAFCHRPRNYFDAKISTFQDRKFPVRVHKTSVNHSLKRIQLNCVNGAISSSKKAQNLPVRFRREFIGQQPPVRNTTAAGRKMEPGTRLRAETTEIEEQGEHKATDKDDRWLGGARYR